MSLPKLTLCLYVSVCVCRSQWARESFITSANSLCSPQALWANILSAILLLSVSLSDAIIQHFNLSCLFLPQTASLVPPFLFPTATLLSVILSSFSLPLLIQLCHMCWPLSSTIFLSSTSIFLSFSTSLYKSFYLPLSFSHSLSCVLQ